MKKQIKNILTAAMMVTAFAVTAVVPLSTPVSAVCDDTNISQSQDPTLQGINCSEGGGVPRDLFGEGSVFTTVVNILLFIIGAISVIMLIIGGIRYTISGGDSGQITSAKNTILYAIVGLIIAFLAFAIVNFVLGGIGSVTN